MSTTDYRDVVLDERTDASISLDKGDFVKCIDCGRLMLVLALNVVEIILYGLVTIKKKFQRISLMIMINIH